MAISGIGSFLSGALGGKQEAPKTELEKAEAQKNANLQAQYNAQKAERNPVNQLISGNVAGTAKIMKEFNGLLN